MPATAPGNQVQAEFWSATGGEAWVDLQDQMDRQLSVVGAATLAALGARTGESIIDIGCGCGATTLDLAAAVGETGRVIGLDISGPMIGLAARRLADRGYSHATAVLGDAQTATLVDVGGPVDAVFSRFGVMFFDDPVAAFTNIRALANVSARMAFVCWQEASKNRIFSDLGRELAKLFPGQPAPDPHAPGPMAFADAERLRSLLASAGWSHIEISAHLAPMQLFGTTDFDVALEASLRVGGAARLMQVVDDAAAQQIRDAARRVLESQWTENGAVVDSATWIVTARNGVGE